MLGLKQQMNESFCQARWLVRCMCLQEMALSIIEVKDALQAQSAL